VVMNYDNKKMSNFGVVDICPEIETERSLNFVL